MNIKKSIFLLSTLLLLLAGCSSDSGDNQIGSTTQDSTNTTNTTTTSLTADGILNTAFGVDGILTDNNASGGNSTDSGYSIVMGSDDTMYIAGYSKNSSNYDMTLWNYNKDGTLNTSFGTDGIVTDNNASGANSDDRGKAVVLDSNGKIYVTGITKNSSDYDMAIWSYNQDGTLNTAFSTDGIVTDNNASGANSVDRGKAIAIGANTKIYVAGVTYNRSNYDMALWSYNQDGTLNTAFGGGDGILTESNVSGGDGHDYATAITLDPDDKIYITGYSYNTSATKDMVLWSYNQDGTVNTTFGTDGVVIDHNASGTNSNKSGLAIALDSKDIIYVAGTIANDIALWSYNKDGTANTSFGENGVSVFNPAASGCNGEAITIDSNDDIFISGHCDEKMITVKFDSTGNIASSTFGINGYVEESINSIAHGIVFSEGELYITGEKYINSSTDMAIWNYK